MRPGTHSTSVSPSDPSVGVPFFVSGNRLSVTPWFRTLSVRSLRLSPKRSRTVWNSVDVGAGCRPDIGTFYKTRSLWPIRRGSKGSESLTLSIIYKQENLTIHTPIKQHVGINCV